jgi:hypothetical protein
MGGWARLKPPMNTRTKMADSALDVPLSQFLNGRYNRISLRETLEGLMISDTLAMTPREFQEGLRQQDLHIGRCFWRNVIAPLREAYNAYNALSRERALVAAATDRLRNLIEAHKCITSMPTSTSFSSGSSLNPGSV